MSQQDHERDLSRTVTCPSCRAVNVPLNSEPDIRYCMECGTDVEAGYRATLDKQETHRADHKRKGERPA